MKRLIQLTMILALSLSLIACQAGNDVANNETTAAKTTAAETTAAETTAAETTADKKIVTVTTTFLEDMVTQLAGDYVDIKLIIPAGEDPHLYVTKPEDVEKISSADLLLYHGIHFEGKMMDALEPTGAEVTRDFEESEIGEMDEGGEMIKDPHFWFNIDLYKKATLVASEELQKTLPEYKEQIKENTTSYLAELDALDAENREALEAIPEQSRKLVTPHDAFNYFSRRYNIGVHAPQGVSTETEVANQDITETVNYIVDNQVKAIFAESTTDPARMDKLKESCSNKGWEVKVVKGDGNELLSDSLAPKGEDGDTFIDMYRHNVKLITDNLK